MLVRPGSSVPVAYDPCRPIHVVVNSRTAPAGGERLFAEALEALRIASGLAFTMDGSTSEEPDEKREPHQRERYPDRWAPVLVAWSDPVESPRLAGDTAGYAGSFPFPSGADRVYVTGGVTLDGPQFQKILGRRDGHGVARAIIQHELGHLVGLAHIADRSQLMNPDGVEGLAAYGPGDLAGLAALGQGKCFPQI